ncbi:uncharacterized protein [Porites lutea]|uniref:uncharacterized protein n=1 Tax=Porites lutea TaxID=51062 RepID=UPI003CC52978
MYENRYIQKIESEVMETAPAPRAELLTVLGLKNEELVPSSSTSFSTVVKWEKPLFTLSNVSYYVYGTTEEIKGQMKRRAIRLNNENTTTETSVIIDGIYLNEKVEFQVTPVFDASVVTGVAAKISIVGTEPSKKFVE